MVHPTAITVPLKDKRTKKHVANKSQTSLRFILTCLRLRLTKMQTKANALSMLINLRKHSHTVRGLPMHSMKVFTQKKTPSVVFL